MVTLVSILCVVVVSSLQYSEWSEWSSPSITAVWSRTKQNQSDNRVTPLEQQLACSIA